MKTFDRNGFTLVEILVAVGLASVVGLGILSFIQSQQKATSSITKNIEFNSLVNEIEMYLMQPETCATLFTGVSINLPSPVPVLPYTMTESQKIKIPVLSYRGSVLAEVGKAKNGLQATRIEFDQILDNTLPPVGVNTQVILRFTLAANKTGENIGSQSRLKYFPIVMEVSPANTVASCASSTNSLMSICMSLGGTFDSSATPPCRLEPRYQ